MNSPNLLSQVGRVTNSHTFRGSPSLCKLLSYLGNQAVDHPGVSVKEYQVATEVFGRPTDFDPKEDSTVRVQAGRLRAKLTEYYNSEGSSDPWIVDLPKGVYALEFHPRGARKAAEAVEGANESGGRAAAAAAHRVPQWNSLALMLLAGFVLATMAAGYLYISNRGHQVIAARPAAAEPLRMFWSAVLTGPADPWAVFSNAAFVGRPDTGMRYYDTSKDHGKLVFDHYTGVGEVLGIHDLDVALASLNRNVRVKRGFLFTLDDARNNDLIFIGSPSENLTLLDIPSTKQFVFVQVKDPPRAGNVKIVNVHPAAGEAREFMATPSNEPLTEDFAIVALVPGVDAGHTELILAGTTTIGTQAAVEFVTAANQVQELLNRLGATSAADVKPFESVVRVKVSKGVPVESTVVTLHKL